MGWTEEASQEAIDHALAGLRGTVLWRSSLEFSRRSLNVKGYESRLSGRG